MNGKTSIDATLNPCSAEADTHTYGWKWLNITTHGSRFLRVGMLGVYLDLYRFKRLPWMRRFIYARYGNGAFFGFPFGSISWPMPQHSPTLTSNSKGEGMNKDIARLGLQLADVRKERDAMKKALKKFDLEYWLSTTDCICEGEDVNDECLYCAMYDLNAELEKVSKG